MLFYIFYNISCKAAHKGNKQLRQSERVHTGFGDDGNGQNRLSAGGYRHFAQPLTGLYRRGERLRQVERGLHAGNYDITRVFIDGLYKIIGGKDAAKAEEFLVALDAFSSKHSVNFTVSLSEEPESATEGMKRFL